MSQIIPPNIEKQVVKLQKMLSDIDKKLLSNKKDNPKYIEWFQKKKWLIQEIDLRLNGIETRRCGRCKELLTLDKFGITFDANEWCKKCRSEYHLSRRSEDIETARAKAREAHLSLTYGLSIEKYEEMFELQSGKCAICHKEETKIDPRTKKVKNLHVDHCHGTGKIRGLLCHGCNAALGHIREDHCIAEAMITYIKEKCI